MTQIISTIMIYAIAFTVLSWAFMIGVDKEIQRLSYVHEHNCEHYGDAMNRHYGREVCHD